MGTSKFNAGRIALGSNSIPSWGKRKYCLSPMASCYRNQDKLRPERGTLLICILACMPVALSVLCCGPTLHFFQDFYSIINVSDKVTHWTLSKLNFCDNLFLGSTSRGKEISVLSNFHVIWVGYVGMCGPKGYILYGFSAILVINGVLILAIWP